jgi:hypothetical protein
LRIGKKENQEGDFKMSVELKPNTKWKDIIEAINESESLEAKIVERKIRKKKRRGEDQTGDTLFIKKKDANAKTVYRKNIKEEKDAFLERVANTNIIDYLNSNIFSAEK